MYSPVRLLEAAIRALRRCLDNNSPPFSKRASDGDHVLFGVWTLCKSDVEGLSSPIWYPAKDKRDIKALFTSL